MSDQMMDTSLIMTITALLLPVIGLIMAITPFLMRRGEVFAVTVPTAAQNDPYLRCLKRHFALIMLAITALFSVAAFAFAMAHFAGGVLALVIVGAFGLTGVGYGLMLHYRAKTKAYKQEQGWVAEAQETVAVSCDQPIPQAISLKWNLLYLPVMALTLAVGVVGYAHMPDMIAMQVGFDGTVSRWSEKTPMIVWMPVLIQGFMAVCFLFSHWTITRSKKWTEPGAPATSALAYGMFARAQSLYIIAGGLAITVGIIAMPLSFMGIVSLGQAGVFIMIAALVMVVGAIAVSVIYGQAGSRVFRRMQGSDVLLADDDTHWKLGIFYCNSDDASLFLPERFGVGWTLNWARPAVWAIVLAGLALTVAFVVAIMVLF